MEYEYVRDAAQMNAGSKGPPAFATPALRVAKRLHHESDFTRALRLRPPPCTSEPRARARGSARSV